jgi:hypothetical protein
MLAGLRPALRGLPQTDHYLSNLPPPAWPFAKTSPINPQLVAEGQKIFAHDCASCHEPRGKFTSKVIPIAQVGTDPERTHSWSKAAAQEANRKVKEMGIERPLMTELDPYGYLSPPLDGLWMRAPYLHNGSVPTLRDLLNPPNERPQTFHRGYDDYDPIKVVFAEPPERAVGPPGEWSRAISFRHAPARRRQWWPPLRHHPAARTKRSIARVSQDALRLASA